MTVGLSTLISVVDGMRCLLALSEESRSAASFNGDVDFRRLATEALEAARKMDTAGTRGREWLGLWRGLEDERAGTLFGLIL